MSWLTLSTIGSAGQLSSLSLSNASELLDILGGLKGKLEGFNNKSPVEILDLLASDQDTYGAIISPALAGLTNRSVSDIIKSWEDVKEKYNGEHGKKFRALSRKFNELNTVQYKNLPKTIEWEIIESDIDRKTMVNTDANFNFGALLTAFIDLEANAKMPVLPSGVEINQNDKVVLRVGMDGQLSLNGKVGFSAGVITSNVSAMVRGIVDADFYFLEEPDTRFGVAAAENIIDLVQCGNGSNVGLCSPFQITYLQNLLNRHGMHCMKLSANSTMKFDVDIGLAKTFNVADKIKVKLGAGVKCTAKETGMFDYLLSAHEVSGEPVIAVHIKRSISNEKTLNESFGLELDPTELVKSLKPLMDEHLGKAEAALTQFEELLPGSDYIKDKMALVIDNKFNDSDFKQDIKVIVGLDAGRTPEEVLRDRIIGTIETSADGWSDKIDTAVPAIVDEVLSSLIRFTPNLPDIKTTVEDAIQAALEEKQAALIQKVKASIANTNAYKSVAINLNEAGANISKTVSNTQKGVNQAATALQKLLTKLQNRVSKIRDLTQVATEKTISLKVAAERKQISQENLDLRFDLYPERDPVKAQEALEAILLGEMNKVISVIVMHRTGNTPPPVVGLTGGYTIYESLSESNSRDLVVWNLDLGSKSIMDADVKWTVNIDGSITATSVAEYTRINSSNSENRTVAFVESAEMLFATQKSTLNVGLTISREDEELSADEVSAFFSGLLSRGLLPQDVVNKARDLLTDAGDKKMMKGRLDIGITFTRNQLDNMFEGVEEMRTNVLCDSNELHCKVPFVLCPEGGGKRGCHWVLNTVSKTVAEVMRKHHSDKILIERLIDVLEVIEIDGGLAAGIRKMTPDNVKSYSEAYEIYEEDLPYYSEFDELLEDLSVLEYRRYGAMALYEIIAHMKTLAKAGESININSNSAVTIPGWTPGELKAHQYRITQIMPVWWQWGNEWKEWAFLTDQMRGLNVALFECWVNLAKGPAGDGQAPLLWASLSLPNKDKVLVPTLLT